MNLKKLILKASLGDKKSLDFIAEKYQNYVCFFCSTVISDSQKAENAFKKSFKAVFFINPFFVAINKYLPSAKF